MSDAATTDTPDMDEATALDAEELPGGGKGYEATFTNGAHTYRYNFDNLHVMQLLLAKSKFNVWQTQFAQLPVTFDTLPHEVQMRLHLGTLNALGHLFRQVDSAGFLVPFDPKQSERQRSEAAAFLGMLPAGDYDALERCRLDFFKRADILDVASSGQLQQHLGLMKTMLEFAESMSRPTKPMPAIANSSNPSESSGDQEEATAPSETPQTLPSSGSSPDTIPADSTPLAA